MRCEARGVMLAEQEKPVHQGGRGELGVMDGIQVKMVVRWGTAVRLIPSPLDPWDAGHLGHELVMVPTHLSSIVSVNCYMPFRRRLPSSSFLLNMLILIPSPCSSCHSHSSSTQLLQYTADTLASRSSRP
jgi:hypothetical protein